MPGVVCIKVDKIDGSIWDKSREAKKSVVLSVCGISKSFHLLLSLLSDPLSYVIVVRAKTEKGANKWGIDMNKKTLMVVSGAFILIFGILGHGFYDLFFRPRSYEKEAMSIASICVNRLNRMLKEDGRLPEGGCGVGQRLVPSITVKRDSQYFLVIVFPGEGTVSYNFTTGVYKWTSFWAH